MFDIGAFELLIVGIVALLVVGPEELPRLIRAVSKFATQVKNYARDFRAGMENLANEADLDGFDELRRKEGITKDMSPEDITHKIMTNKIMGDDTKASQENISDQTNADKDGKETPDANG